MDETHLFGNGLVVVSGGFSGSGTILPHGGGVWNFLSSTSVAQLADLGSGDKRHLEGVITLTNTAQDWGPWAGKLITGAEDRKPPLVFAVATNGTAASFDMGIEPEDFDIIQTNQDLYCISEGVSEFQIPDRIVKLPRSLLTNYWGGLIIPQEGAQIVNERHAKLFIVQWNSTNSTFVTRCIPYAYYFEHVTFSPISIPPISNEE